MVKPIMKDIFFLGQKSEEATRTDLQVGKDLEDTLEANREGCVGMAANIDWCQKESDHCQHGFGGSCHVQSSFVKGRYVSMSWIIWKKLLFEPAGR